MGVSLPLPFLRGFSSAGFTDLDFYLRISSRFDCLQSAHTSRLYGESVVLDEACKGTRWAQWSGRALSIRCCTGGPGKEFCDVKDDKHAVCKWR